MSCFKISLINSHMFLPPEMQCCDHLELVSTGGVLECHPYVIGSYRRIGSCGGRSFYQHANNTDIFMYHACGAWYVGLEVGLTSEKWVKLSGFSKPKSMLQYEVGKLNFGLSLGFLMYGHELVND